MYYALTTDSSGKLTNQESKTLEYKRDLSHPQVPLPTLVAFANAAGGQLVVGVNHDLSICGGKDSLGQEECLEMSFLLK